MNVELLFFVIVAVLVTFGVNGIVLPKCNRTEYYEPGLYSCQACPANVSMVTSTDGFSCVCEEHSVSTGIARCKACNPTEVVSADGTACVPRKCQNLSGRYVCRKCPNDYISVTQNFDGSPMKEVLCVKCARGYKAQGNICVRCESCACTKNQIVLKGICIPKRYLSERPKHEETKMHPSDLLEFVKHEYLCTQNDVLACRTLTRECVKSFYATDLAGPCRLWLQPKLVRPKGLPHLTIDTKFDKKPGDVIDLSKGKVDLLLAVAIYTSDGKMKFLEHHTQKPLLCLPPIKIKIGNDFSYDCNIDISTLASVDNNSTFEIFNIVDGEFRPIPVMIRKTSGSYIQKDSWSTNKFRRYFIVDNVLSIDRNETNTVYLRSMDIRIDIQRQKYKSSSLQCQIIIELQYTTKPSLTSLVTTSLTVSHDMPNAGVIRGLEIWGGTLGSLLALYALIQWRGELRRGGILFSLVPLLAGSVADALYFAAILSALHALAAEAGTLGMTLPLSKNEENILKAFVYSSVSLKALKLAWLNWKQCVCDIFFLDWTEYNTSYGGDSSITGECNNYKTTALAREWSAMQTKRRAPPGYTVTVALFIFYLSSAWQDSLPPSRGYKWTVVTLAWWSAYTIVLLFRFILDKILGPPSSVLPKLCTSMGLSLLVFQDEYYAHYVHGRSDDSKELRSIVGPLAMCRVVVATQLRAVYKQLSSQDTGFLGESDPRHALLSRFLAAFFERALDGLNWVASERSVLERLLDVELTVRETGSTSVLLYDPNDAAPSCFAVTWWCEEWTLVTFDAMLFGSIVITTGDSLLGALITVIMWQVMKQTRSWFGIRNLNRKIGTEVSFYP
ncbi:uncharacterized protein LOC113521805 [Galleria mellonella]|uniref:Uncharacterized protein LOC113521805 n=1 Tax=Galleria mellonella TaxID=7137 RepID=A0A6J3C071_GALME|nr:uncharacterized protein LOC113521805 [Galleria mellonella]